MSLALKTSVNTRLPLASRLPRISTSQDKQQTNFCSIHQTKETTYDSDYVAIPADMKPNQLHGINSRSTSIFNRQPKSSHEANLETKMDVVSPQLPYKVISDPSSRWESEAHAATRFIEPGRQTDFYSIARQIERKHDDARVYGPNITQRAEQIRLMRSRDPTLRPSNPEYLRVPHTQVFNGASQRRQVKNYLDLVECSHLNPDSEQQIDFGTSPLSRLPDLDFPQSIHPQSKIITKMGTSNKLFQGTAKYLEHKIVGYTGHVPKADSNLEAMRNGQDPRAAFAKAYITLAVSGGGVDASVNGRNAFAFRSRGRYARDPVALKPKSDETICRMVEGSMLQQTIHRTLDCERALNAREDNKQMCYF